MSTLEEQITAAEAKIEQAERDIEQARREIDEAKRDRLDFTYIAVLKQELIAYLNTQNEFIKVKSELIKARNLLLEKKEEHTSSFALDLTSIDNSLSTTQPTLKKSKANKASGSTFAASVNTAFSGFGMMSHCLFYDTTDYEVELGGRSDNPILTPFNSSTEVLNSFLRKYNLSVERAARTIRDVVMVYNDLGKVSETNIGNSKVGKNLTVQSNHLDEIARLFKWTTSTNTKINLSCFPGCDVGLATEDTVADGYILDDNDILRGILEVKNNTDTPAESLRQGLSTATNVAIMQLRKGVAWNNIMVPVVSSNGYLFQFAVVYLLYPSFPATMTISPVLDATDPKILKEIARLLCCIKLFIGQNPISGTLAPAPSKFLLAYSLKWYYPKSIKNIFLARDEIQPSLFHMFNVLSRLHSDPDCRKFVLFPLCIREYEGNVKETEILFPNLTRYGYQIGLPRERILRQSYLQQIRLAMQAFHNAGVAHLDLFPSNFMWKANGDNSVSMKVIDWDAAHFLDDILFQETRIRLDGIRHQLKTVAARRSFLSSSSSSTAEGVENERVVINDDMNYYDISLFQVLERNIDNDVLQVSEKKILDRAFQTLLYDEGN